MNIRNKQLIWLIVSGIVAMVGAILVYPDVVLKVTHEAPPMDPGIPLSFSGNRLAYGFAFFSLFSISSLAIRQLIVIGAQLRAEGWRSDPDVGLYRMTLAAAMMTILLGAGPDVILLLLWGEAGDRTLTTAMTLDRMGDGLTIIPFIAATMLRVRAEQFQRRPNFSELYAAAPEIDVGPRDRSLFMVAPQSESIWENMKIIVFVMVIAAGLAAWK